MLKAIVFARMRRIGQTQMRLVSRVKGVEVPACVLRGEYVGDYWLKSRLNALLIRTFEASGEAINQAAASIHWYTSASLVARPFLGTFFLPATRRKLSRSPCSSIKSSNPGSIRSAPGFRRTAQNPSVILNAETGNGCIRAFKEWFNAMTPCDAHSGEGCSSANRMHKEPAAKHAETRMPKAPAALKAPAS